MSGGHFDYGQWRIYSIAEEVELLIASGDYDQAEVAEFRNGLAALKAAFIYVQRIDWFVSGDDGEESFHQRLKEELSELHSKDTQK